MPARGQLKWGSVEALQQKIDEYFDGLEQRGDVPSQVGLALWLDIQYETITYYTSDRFKARLSAQAKQQADADNSTLEPDEIEDNLCLKDITMETISIGDDVDNIKMQVSNTFKKAAKRVEGWWIRTGASSKNPFPMYYLKAYCGRYDVPIESDRDKPQVLEVRLSIQPPDQPAQLPAGQSRQLPQVQVLPDKKPD